MLIISNYFDGNFYIKKRTKKEKIDKDEGLIVSWLTFWWDEKEQKFGAHKDSNSFLIENDAFSRIEKLIKEHSNSRRLMKIKKVNDFQYEGFECDEKVIEWTLEKHELP